MLLSRMYCIRCYGTKLVRPKCLRTSKAGWSAIPKFQISTVRCKEKLDLVQSGPLCSTIAKRPLPTLKVPGVFQQGSIKTPSEANHKCNLSACLILQPFYTILLNLNCSCHFQLLLQHDHLKLLLRLL